MRQLKDFYTFATGNENNEFDIYKIKWEEHLNIAKRRK